MHGNAFERYIGPTHEYIWSDTAKDKAKLVELSVVHHEDGGSRKDKYLRDIELLRRGLEIEPENARYVFYLAQSYRDSGNLPQAIEWYEKRASMGGWDEEVWYSLYQVARLQHRLGLAWPLVLDAYLRAFEFRATRVEPVYHVAKLYRENEQYHLGYLFSSAVIDTPYPDDILFIEKSIYDYELPLEYARCCERLGKMEETIRAIERVLACSHAPAHVVEAARRLKIEGGVRDAHPSGHD